jgi:phenylpyruvate tautomerase PptA (4-oxalocrotonate tautomerase family)
MGLDNKKSCVKQLYWILVSLRNLIRPNMPMIKLTIPEASLDQSKQDKLVWQRTDTLLKWEGALVDNAAAQAISWAFVDHQQKGTFYIGGEPIAQQHWKGKVTTPEGVLDGTKKVGLVADVAKQVRDITGDQDVGPRIWCIIREVTDGNWGSDSRMFRRRDIVKMDVAG